jgi:hypothetical protein
MAWQYVSPEVTVKGFKKCCISSAVDETDNGMLWNGSEEGTGTYCEDGDSDADR